MAEYQAPIDDMRFILFNVLHVQTQWRGYKNCEDLDEATALAILDEAAKLCEQEIAPLNQVGDQQGCRWSDGDVATPSGFKHAYQMFCDGAWGGLGGNPHYGGMGMPKALVSAVEEMVQGACMSFGLAPMLTAGACLALESHGSEQLKSTYLENMYSGKWSGAMDLTEPHAGTDLGMLRSKAEAREDGSYSITGNKIFITWGEHDMAENIVHLVLARVAGAPDGSKGISMFLVPKFIPNDDGTLGERNSLVCGALESKMGIKGSATCVMNYDGAKGWLVGDVNQGLACMFTMMNYERVVVGIQGLATAHWSYLNALAYAKERLQGKGPLAGESDKTSDLLSHPDVRRMLLTSKAYLEGGRAFYMYVAKCLDAAKYSTDEASRATAQARVALLTPVAKAFLTDIAFDSAVLGQQVLGGHGYIKESGQEQMVRDIRITQIYEGTNGIQAMDLIGRKTYACNGDLLKDFLAEIKTFLQDNSEALSHLPYTDDYFAHIALLHEVTQIIIEKSNHNSAEMGAVAVEYLHFLGHVAIGYLWLKMAVSASECGDEDFKSAKLTTCQFYFERLMPKVIGLAGSIKNGGDAIKKMQRGYW